MSRNLRSWLFALACLFMWRPAQAEPAPMTRAAIIELAKPAVGHGYFWGHDTWTSDGSKRGTCSGTCPTCTFSGTIGTDCSGLVAKAWGVPSQLPITQFSHAYSTHHFRYDELHWKRIERSQLKRGDALVYRNAADTAGHIVLFDRLGTDGHRYWVYEARGCRDGVVYNQRDFGAEYIAIRRTNLLESEPVTCSTHGQADALDGCQCDPGYAGASCESCASGYYGFPSCVREGSSCEPTGSIQCGDVVAVNLGEGQSLNSNYACTATGFDGPEVVYEFRPLGRGKASLALSDEKAGVQLLALKQTCDATSCIAASPNTLELEYSEGDVFYVAVESTQATTTQPRLTIACTEPKQAWVGDACQSDADCDLSHQPDAGTNGRCFKHGAAAFCTLPCARLCPDLLPDKAQTFCIPNPELSTTGMCVPRSDRKNAQCSDIAGTIELFSERFGQSEVQELACVPPAASACSGVILGHISEFDSTPKKPVVGAIVRIQNGSFSEELRSDALGNYESSPIPCGSVRLNVEAQGFLNEQTQLQLNGNERQENRLKALPLACEGLGAVTGIVRNAVTGSAVGNARIDIFASSGRAQGTPVASVSASALGLYEFTNITAGNYTARVEAPGHAPLEQEVVICGGRTLTGATFFLSEATDAALTFVLSWTRPADLDLHLQLPNGEEVYFDDLCQGSTAAFPYATLDIDHRLGDGPESLHVSKLIPGGYTLFVHNYSQDFTPSEPAFTDSDAQVFVFGTTGKLLGRFPVPTRGAGLYWDVAAFEGLHPDKLIPLQRLSAARVRPEDYVQACRP